MTHIQCALYTAVHWTHGCYNDNSITWSASPHSLPPLRLPPQSYLLSHTYVSHPYFHILSHISSPHPRSHLQPLYGLWINVHWGSSHVDCTFPKGLTCNKLANCKAETFGARHSAGRQGISLNSIRTKIVCVCLMLEIHSMTHG